MRKTLFLTALLLSVNFINAFSKSGKTMADFRIIPLPNEISVQKGESFILDQNVKIFIASDNQQMQRNAAFLQEYLKEKCALDLKISSSPAKGKCIELTTGLKNNQPEGYQITVNSQKITIDAPTANGIFYGIQTLRKAVPAGKIRSVEFQPVVVSDAPRFPYRGMHLDVARHFFSIDEVKTYIDILALHNINTFHWHLTDDQGWRVEIKKYPKLTEIGSKRDETVIGKNTGKYDGIPYGGFYTQNECREIVAYAAERYINVIPEIDMPGHMLGALEAYPELGCTGGPYKVWRKWGISEDVLCVGNDNTIKFIDDVLSEIVDIFPSKYIHIGGDECPKTSWKKCPKCQAKIQELGLIANEKHTAEEMLQSYFISQAEKFINSKGRSIIGWDEILEGGIAPNATVMSWRGVNGGIAAAQQKHDVIMTPNTYLYFDYYQTDDIEGEPFGIGGYLPLSKVYDYEPIPATLSDDEKKHILGAQANVWTEYIPNFKHAEYMTLPRMTALCEVQWSKPEQKNYRDFLNRIPVMLKMYDIYGYNFARHIFDVSAAIKADQNAECVTVALSSFDNAPIRYTLDGTTPAEKSALYKDTLRIKKNTIVKAVAFRGGKPGKVMTERIEYNLSTLKPVTAILPLSNYYRYNGITTLVDGLKGKRNFQTGRWIGFTNGMEVVIDLQKTTKIQEVSFSNIVETGASVFNARNFSVAISTDSVNFTTIATEDYPEMKADEKNGIYDHTLRFSPVETRYVKVKAASEKSIPDWHNGKGKPAFLFVDEVEIK